MGDSRARIGLIVPSTNTTNEPEFVDHVPPDVSVHTARVEGGDCTVETLERMADDIERSARLLSHARVDVIAFGCTTGSLVRGPDYADELRSRIRDVAEVPAVVTAGAVSEALSTLDAESLSVTTPYPDEINRLLREYLVAQGFEILELRGLDLVSPEAVAEQPTETVVAEARAVADERADCLFISCTDYPTFDVIDTLEAELGCPVVTSNQATLWRALGVAGLNDTAPGLGQLFEQ